MAYRIRILFIEDEPDNVEAVQKELQNTLPDPHLKVTGFEQFKEVIEAHDPHIVVLDLLQGTGAEAEAIGLETLEYVWGEKFCPLIIYTAQPDLVDSDERIRNHPFVRVVKKGDRSEELVRQSVQDFEPHIDAIVGVAREIGSVMNDVLKEMAKNIFDDPEIKSPKERREVLIRSARRRVAAKMDEGLLEEDPLLKSWEFYLWPPVVAENLLTGDIIRKRDGDKENPASYRVVLTPSCDLVKRKSGKAKVDEALVAACTDVKPMLLELFLDNQKDWNDESHKKKLRSTLSQGYGQSRIPLARLFNVLPTMVADLRKLQLIKLDDIGGEDKEYVRIASVDNPLRELVSWAYMLVAARPGLPDRDFGAWADEIIRASEKGN